MDAIQYNSKTQEVSVIVHSIDTDEKKVSNSIIPIIPVTNGMNGLYNHESNHISLAAQKSNENHSKHNTDNEVHYTDENKLIIERNDKDYRSSKGNSAQKDGNNLDIISMHLIKSVSPNNNHNTRNDNKLNTEHVEVSDNTFTISACNSLSPQLLTTSDVNIPSNKHEKDNSMTIIKRKSSSDNAKQNNNESVVAVSDTEPEHTTAHRVKMLTGFILTCVSALFFSITAVIVKYVKNVDPGEMACIRFFWILLFSFPVMLESNKHPFGPSNLRHWLVLRGLAGATSLYFRYCALHYLPIADATVIISSMPIFVCVFARIFLKEPCGIFHCIALVVTLTGIAFTTKLAIIFGSSEEEMKEKGIDSKKEIIGLLYSMGATLVGSGAYIIVRKIKGVHHSVILFNFSWVAIVELAAITTFTDGFTLPKGDVVVWLLCLLGLLSFYGQLLLTKALQNEEAGIVSVTRASTEVIYAFIFQITIFGEIPDGWSIIGAVLVTLSVTLISSRKWILSLPHESGTRKALNFITK